MEIRCPKSILNVAERAKKGKNRYISGFRACSGRRSRRFKSCHPDQKYGVPFLWCSVFLFQGMAGFEGSVVNACRWQAEPTTAPSADGQHPVIPTISSVHNVYEVMNTRFFCFYSVLVDVRYSTSTPFLVLTFILSKFSGISSSPMNL